MLWLFLGPFFGECKELNRAGPLKIIVQYPHTPTQKRKINMFHISIFKKKIMFHVSISKLKNMSLVKIIANFDFGN